MSPNLPNGPDSLPLEDARRLDELCDRVEQAWQAGQRPQIEEYLAECPDAARAQLLRELLALEGAYRRRNGETPTADEYRGRFPELTEDEFAGLLSAAAPAPLPGASSTGPWSLRGTEPPVAPPPPETRYRPLRFHARGGLGEVHVAQDTELGREVALKRIQARHLNNPDSRRRFLREAQVTSRLEHPGVVPVYGLVEGADGEPSYAMRFIAGQSLKEAIAEFHVAERPGRDPGERALALRQLLGRFTSVCQTIAYAHSKGVIHRDLKPANVMLGAYGETLVVDWGLARILGSPDPDEARGPLSAGGAAGGTEEGQVMGTLAYMSPEQAAGRQAEVGPASDIYSLGATLYALLTGQAPLQGDDRRERLERGRRGEFPPPRQVKRDVPKALEAACLKAMALRPEDRYPTAADQAREMDRWLADEPLTAYREPLVLRARRWVRRHRTVVASAAAALLVALLLGGGIWWWWERTREAARTQMALQVNALLTAATQEHGESRNAPGRQQLDLLRSARAKAEAAREALQAGEADAGLHERVEALRDVLATEERRAAAALEQAEKNVATVHRLDEARLLLAGVGRERTLLGQQGEDKGFVFEGYHLDAPKANQAGRDAFTNHGIDLDQLSVAEAAQRIGRQAIRRELVAALDWLAPIQANARKGRHLLAVAEAADDDPWRNGVRALIRKGGTGGLVRMAASREVEVQPPASVVILAEELFRAGQVKPAVRLLSQVQERHPRDFWLTHQLAAFLHRSDPPRSAEAVRFFQAALALRESATVYTNFALALADTGDLQGALKARRKAVALEPDEATFHYNLGCTLTRAGQLKAAAEAYRQAIKLQPTFVMAHDNLGAVLALSNDLDGAIGAFRKAVQLQRDHARGYYNLGNAFLLQQQPAEAIKQLEQAIRFNEKNGAAYQLLATAQIRLKDFPGAIATLRRGAAKSPDHHAVGYLLGHVLATTGDLDGAIKEFRRTLQIKKDPLVYYELAKALLGRKRLEESKIALGQFTALMRLKFQKACFAVLVAGQGQGAIELSAQDRTRLRKQALDSLQTDAKAWSRVLSEGRLMKRPPLSEQLKLWPTHPALASVRDGAALDRLPEPEAAHWRRLWADVEALLKPAPARKP